MTPKKTTGLKHFRETVEMLQHLDEATRAKIIQNVAEKDPGLAKDLLEQMFTFEDICRIVDRDMQRLIPMIPQAKWCLALRKCSDLMKEHVFKNMSARAAETLKEEIASSPPKKISEVEAAQNEIRDLVKDLEKQGKLGIPQKS